MGKISRLIRIGLFAVLAVLLVSCSASEPDQEVEELKECVLFLANVLAEHQHESGVLSFTSEARVQGDQRGISPLVGLTLDPLTDVLNNSICASALAPN